MGNERVGLDMDSRVMGIKRQEKEGRTTLDWKEFVEFLRELSKTYRTKKIPQWVLYRETSQRGWDRSDVVTCLRFLHRRGNITIGKNFEIILNE